MRRSLRDRFGPRPRPFRDFMEIVLHAPGGYYARGGTSFGPTGDYITGPTLGPEMGRTLANVAAELAAALEGPVDVVEAGAGDGSLLVPLVAEAGAGIRRVVAIERSAGLRRTLTRRLAGAQVLARAPRNASWRGLLVANELFDALPVHLLMGTDDGPREMYVDWSDAPPRWVQGAAPDARLLRYLARHQVALAPGQLAEVSLGAAGLVRRLLAPLERGLAIFFDYGERAARLYDPRIYAGGTLTAHRRHTAHRDLLAFPGEQDLTAHVNWDEIERAVRSADAVPLMLVPQAHLLLAAGLAERLAADAESGAASDGSDPAAFAAARSRRQLVDPAGMGERLRALVAWKGGNPPRLPFLERLAGALLA